MFSLNFCVVGKARDLHLSGMLLEQVRKVLLDLKDGAEVKEKIYLLDVKAVYLEGLAESWEEDKLKKLCEQYGEDEKVQFVRKFLSTRRKDFGFVSFVTRESAVACVEGINKFEIGEGDNKVKANLAKPQYKGRIGKKAAKGGYKVQMDGQKIVVEASKMKGNNISKRPQGKGKGVANKQNDRWNKSHYPGSSGKQNDKGVSV
ncbi:hypothetical protein Syun_010347 [Stephania yunnanensis]|uniref:RRM domain-containing protein n=1 Tax=Stephania yunnanensis TaxID=152371 RepID=A0AAP0KGC5_9MAGN